MASNAPVAESNATGRKLSGLERASILMLALGESHAADILRHMSPKEVQEIGLAMTGLSNVTSSMMEQVMGDFVDTIGSQTALGLGSDDYIRNMLTQALGPEKAAGVINRILLGRNSKGIEQLKWMDPRSIAELIRVEHPQVIAIVISFLEPDQAARVLAEFPERLRGDVVMRIATLDGIQPTALQALDEILDRQFAGSSQAQSSVLGGIKAAASILNLSDGGVESRIMEQILAQDEELAQTIQDNMFVFDNLKEVDDRGIQTLLREIASDQLLLALRGADDELKDKIFRNMSKRAAEMLREDLAAAAPARLVDVEAAQKEILAVARRLADAGEMALGGAGGEAYV